MPLLVEGCYKGLGGNPIIENFNLKIQKGELRALVGESGAGKTTLLRCLSGLYDVDKGSVTVDGKTIKEMGAPEWRANVVYSAQDRMSAGFADSPYELALVIGGLQSVKKPGLASKAIEIALRLNISQEKFRGPWTNLSGGETARCKISILLAQNPSYLLLDEPTAALDERTALLVEKEVRASGSGVLWVTHNPAQAERFDSVYKLQKRR